MTSENAKNENFSIKWNRIHLSIIGAWPRPDDEDGRIANFISFLAGFIVFINITLPQTAFAITVWPNLSLVAGSLSIANMEVTVAVMKLFAICKNRQEFRQFIISIYKDWNRNKSELETKIMKSNASISTIITIYCVTLTMSVVILFLGSEVYFNLNGKYQVRQWLYLSYFPYDTSDSPAYEIILLSQFFGGFISGIIFCGNISFCAMLVLHLHGQFEILQLHIEQYINASEFQRLTQNRSELKIFFVRHEQLNRFANTIEETFNKVFLLEFLVFSFQLCLQGFNFLLILLSETFSTIFIFLILLQTTLRARKMTFFEYIFFVTFVFNTLANLFVTCFLGEKLENASLQLRGSVLNSKWYNLKSKESLDLIMLILRTKTPLKITAGKFVAFSYETFMAVLKRAFAFMSVLLNMNQK